MSSTAFISAFVLYFGKQNMILKCISRTYELSHYLNTFQMFDIWN